MHDSILNHVWGLVVTLLAGSTAQSFIAHMVNTAPTPENKWARWALGGLQWWAGSRNTSKNTLQGADTAAIPVVRGTGDGSPIAPIPLDGTVLPNPDKP